MKRLPLTTNERHVARLIAWGNSDKEIARDLGTTLCAIKETGRRIRAKLHLENRTQVALWYLSRELAHCSEKQGGKNSPSST